LHQLKTARFRNVIQLPLLDFNENQQQEVFSRAVTGWLYQQYGAGQGFHLTSVDLEIEIRQLYRRLSIPAAVEQVEEEEEAERH
jgi:hypothetical protein